VQRLHLHHPSSQPYQIAYGQFQYLLFVSKQGGVAKK
jgi:hypothetical protein